MSATDKTWVNNQPPSCEDADLNGFKNENNNLILASGQSLNTGDLQQTNKAVAHYAGSGAFYTDSGIADAYELDPIGSHVAPPAYTDGMQAEFLAGNTSAGASTVDVAGLGQKNIVDTGTAGTIVSGERYILRYRSGPGDFEITPRAVLSRDFISAEQTITAAGPLTIAHGLGAMPALIQCRLICKIAEHNYSVDDEVIVANNATEATTAYGISINPDAINLNLRFGAAASTFLVTNKVTGLADVTTNANWRLIVRAWL